MPLIFRMRMAMGTACTPVRSQGAVLDRGMPMWAGTRDDANATVHPGLPDPCDGVDNDCDQAIDEDGLTVAFYLDLDGDGFAGPTPYVACVLPPRSPVCRGPGL